MSGDGTRPVSDRDLERAYDLSSAGYDERFSALQAPKFEALLSRCPPGPGDLVLDLGCGTGLLAEWLPPERERPIVGIDLSIAMLRPARARGLRAVRGTLRALPFRAGVFDVVLGVTSLLADRPRVIFAFLEVGRVLKKGGRFGLTLLAGDIWPALADDLAASGFIVEDEFSAGQDRGWIARRWSR